MSPQRTSRKRLGRRSAFVVAVVLLVLAHPAVRSGGKAALMALEVVPSPVRPLTFFTPDPTRTTVRLPGGEADLYEPRGFSEAPAVVLVHGANPDGKDDADLVQLARSFAAAGRRVLVPQLELRHQRLDRTDPERIRQAIGFFGGGGRVGVVAFSYGAGLSVVALGDRPSLQPRVAFLATMGTYFDPAHIIRGVTTSTVPSVDGLVPWTAAAEGRDVFAAQLAAFLGGADGQKLLDAWERKDPAGLSPDALAAYDLAANTDPERFAALYGRLPDRVRALLAEVSPARVAARLRVPLFALHTRSDGASPPTESRLLAAALPDGVTAEVTEIGIFEHVRPTASPLDDLGDTWRLFRYSGRLLRMQEGWPRP